MTDVDPPRLRDGDGPLADLLRQGHDDLPDASEMEAFLPRLDPPPPPPTPASTAPWIKTAGSLGAIAVVAAVGLSLRPAPPARLAVVASVATPSAPLPTAPLAATPDGSPLAAIAGSGAVFPYNAPSALAVPSAEQARRPASSLDPLHPAARTSPIASPSPVDASPRVVAPAHAEAAPSATTPAPSATGPDPMLELTLLDRARRQSTSSPAEALALVAEHTRLFPRSSFGLEREVIAIEALARSGRRPEAQDRARRLLDASPRSAYRERLERLLR